MSRNRMVKAEFWEDEKIGTVQREARLTFIALWNLSDDYGVVKGNTMWLKNRIFPYDEDLSLSDFKIWLSELEKITAIFPFTNNGEKYFFIKNFLKHQKIDRPTLSKKNPVPPEEITELSESS